MANDPTLSICIPTPKDPDRLELLDRVLDCFRDQTAKDFEVVVAVDGGGEADLHHLEDPTFDLVVVPSPRTPGREDIAHRNHARNAAWRAARGKFVWFVTCDFLLPRHAVEHMIKACRQIRRSGYAPVLSVVMSRLLMEPDEWLEVCGHDLHERAETCHLAGTYSGFYDSKTDPAAGVSTQRIDLAEGMPCLPRLLVEILGGFDEDFIGWGGNGEEFSDRLMALASVGLCDVHLVKSVHAIHQPHARDATMNSRGTKARQRHREAKRRDLAKHPSWWTEKIGEVREAMPVLAGEAAWRRRSEYQPPPSVLSACPEVAKFVRRRGPIMVHGTFASPLASFLSMERACNARSASPDEDWSGASAAILIDVPGDELLLIASKLRPGTAIVLFVPTRAQTPGAPQPFVYQRMFPGIATRGQRVIEGNRLVLFSGRLVRWAGR